MDIKPNLVSKYTPKVNVKMCETCLHRKGDFYNDADGDVRIFCKARYTSVKAEQMQKWCDFYSKKL